MSDQLAQEALWAFLLEFLGLGAVFAIGLLVAIRQGDIGWHSPQARRWFAILLGGYVLHALLQGVFQFSFLWN